MQSRDEIKQIACYLLSELGARPVVPFMETPVSSFIANYLDNIEIKHYTDKHGNLIAHHSGSQHNGTDIALVAHMDHPGFEGLEINGDDLTAKALGGLPSVCFSEQINVQILGDLYSRTMGYTNGTIGNPKDRIISIRSENITPITLPCPIVLDLPDFEFDGNTISMRALDDLSGCAAILTTLTLIKNRKDVSNLYCIFTRAEEVGLIGARLIAADKMLSSDTIVISLEASSTLPGAIVGGGPVIRVGDANFTFDVDAESVLTKASETLLDRQSDYKIQRQLMNGGTCEASAFIYHGYRATGIAFPLGNYHNSGIDGDVLPEFIDIDDFISGIELILESIQSTETRRLSRPWQKLSNLDVDQVSKLYQSSDNPY